MLEPAHKQYQILQKISEGAYGVVYKCKHIHTQSLYAMKKFKSSVESQKQGLPKSFLREYNMLNLIKSERALLIQQYYTFQDEVFLILEWLDCNLNQFLYQEDFQSIGKKRIFQDICKGLKDIHDQLMIHRDLKLTNIMVTKKPTPNSSIQNVAQDQSFVVKIIDYGMAREVSFEENRPITNQVGTLYYRAPELLIGERIYSQEIDIWSLGCIFYTIITKKSLFTGKNQMEQLSKIVERTGFNQATFGGQCSIFVKEKLKTIKITESEPNWSQIEGQISVVELDLLRKMLCINPKERLTIKQILLHQYFKE